MIDSWLFRPARLIDRHRNLVVVDRAAELVFGYREHEHNRPVTFFTGAR
ncbi:hypothetical protein ACH4MA_03385 [Streptomyces roseolus]